MAPSTDDVRSRVRGSLLGLAVGDVLGAPLENLDASVIRARFGWVDAVLERGSRVRGLYTDDTQQALVLAEVLRRKGRFDRDVFRDLLLDLQKLHAHRGTGRNFRAALSLLATVTDPLEAGQDSAGNGAAMRIAPLGLFYRDEPEARVGACSECSLVTHHDPRGVAAAAALAGCVADLASGMDPPDVAGRASEHARVCEDLLRREYLSLLANSQGAHARAFSSLLEDLPALTTLEPSRALARIVESAREGGNLRLVTHACQGYAGCSVIASLYFALSTPDFETALTLAVNQGDDADTVGAMTGALAGARFGEASLPSRWTEALLRREDIARYGDFLWSRDPSALTDLPDLVIAESNLTRRERARQP